MLFINARISYNGMFFCYDLRSQTLHVLINRNSYWANISQLTAKTWYIVVYIDSHIPGAMTSSSHRTRRSVMGNWTMTYLKGGRLYGQYRETVAAAGTAPGYWPHSVYCHRVGADVRGLAFVKPTTKLFALYAYLSVYTIVSACLTLWITLWMQLTLSILYTLSLIHIWRCRRRG